MMTRTAAKITDQVTINHQYMVLLRSEIYAETAGFRDQEKNSAEVM